MGESRQLRVLRHLFGVGTGRGGVS
jgi:hypothetical protein